MTDPKTLAALQQVYDMACEMSHSNSYAEVDEDGEDLGTDPDVLAALDRVRRHFNLRGEP